jgi:hypothetical protein
MTSRRMKYGLSDATLSEDKCLLFGVAVALAAAITAVCTLDVESKQRVDKHGPLSALHNCFEEFEVDKDWRTTVPEMFLGARF